MFKRLILGLCLLMLVPLASVQARPIDTLIKLADNFPTDTVLFMATRADDDFINALDHIAAEIDHTFNQLGGPLVSPVSFRLQEQITPLRDLLDDMARDAFDTDFETSIRPWLGDTIAIGVSDIATLVELGESSDPDALMIANDFPMMFAMEITDQTAIQMALEKAREDDIVEGTLTRIDALGNIFYRDSVNQGGILITPDTMLFGGVDDLLNTLDSPLPTLTESALFSETIHLLPEPNYSIIGYFDYGHLMTAAFEIAEQDPTMTPLTDAERAFLEPVLDTVHGVSFGMTMLNGRTLTMDMATTADYSGLVEYGFKPVITAPIDSAFTRYMPANAGLIMMGTDLRTLYKNSIDNLRATARLQSTFENIPPDQRLREADINSALFFLQFWLRMSGGLNLENDILSWMDSDYALVLGIRDEVRNVRRLDSLRASPLDFALLFDVTSDPEGAAKTIEGMREGVESLLDQYEADIRDSGFTITPFIETIAQTQVQGIGITDQLGFLPFPIEVLAAANEDVLIIGSRDMVMTALNENGTLRETTAYEETETNHLLPDTSSLLLINSKALQPIADLYRIADPTNPYAEQDAATIRQVLNIFSSMSISSSYLPEDNALVRATISLNLSD